MLKNKITGMEFLHISFVGFFVNGPANLESSAISADLGNHVSNF